MGVRRVHAFGTSQLLYMQLSSGGSLGLFHTSFRVVDPLFVKLKNLLNEFEAFDLQIIPARANHRAETLAHTAIDRSMDISQMQGKNQVLNFKVPPQNASF